MCLRPEEERSCNYWALNESWAVDHNVDTVGDCSSWQLRYIVKEKGALGFRG